MSEDFSTGAVLRCLDHGESVFIPASTRRIILMLVFALLVGAGLLALLPLLVAATVEDGRGWGLLVTNLRTWALVFGIIGCLIIAPIAAVVRLRRREALVISPTGVSWARHGQVLPGRLLPWHDINAIVYERPMARQPKVVSYILTEEATRRLRGRGLNPRVLVLGGLVVSPRRLQPTLAAAHARYSARPHEDR